MYSKYLKIEGQVRYEGIPLSEYPLFQENPEPTFLKQNLRKLKYLCKCDAEMFLFLLEGEGLCLEDLSRLNKTASNCLKKLVNTLSAENSFIAKLFKGEVSSTKGKSMKDKILIIESFIRAA